MQFFLVASCGTHEVHEKYVLLSLMCTGRFANGAIECSRLAPIVLADLHGVLWLS